MKKVTLEETGYDNWLELWEELVTGNLTEEKTIALFYEGTEKSVSVEVDQVRIEAFKELYPQLPLKASVETLLELINNPEVSNSEIDPFPFRQFLNKVPTRVEPKNES